MYASTIACSGALFVIIVLLFMLRKKLNLFLRDKSILPLEERPFSLASTLTFYWTVLIFLSICYIGIVSDNIVPISSSVLILMGIVIGTTTAGKVIDTVQSTDDKIERSQDVHPSEGFLTDILSDSNGISVSRFQTLAFNIVYGFIFLSIVVSQHLLYEFPTQTLVLLGISSGAYAMLKIPENAPKTVNPSTH